MELTLILELTVEGLPLLSEVMSSGNKPLMNGLEGKEQAFIITYSSNILISTGQ